MLPLTKVCYFRIDLNTTILKNSLRTSSIMSFPRKLNKICQNSCLFSKMLGNKTADFHKQITLSNFSKCKFRRINSALNRDNLINRFSKRSLQSEMTSVTFKSKTQKCKPSLGSGVKTV